MAYLLHELRSTENLETVNEIQFSIFSHKQKYRKL